MSAEDQFTTIKNLLQALTESQVHAEALAAMRHQETLERDARADKEMAELRQLSKASDERLDRHIAFVVETLDRTDRQIAATAAAQEVTEERLQKLINKVDTVDDRVTKLEKKKP